MFFEYMFEYNICHICLNICLDIYMFEYMFEYMRVKHREQSGPGLSYYDLQAKHNPDEHTVLLTLH